MKQCCLHSRAGNNLFKNRLTSHPVIDYFLSLLGRTLREPVVTEQNCDLVCVHQLPRHEGQRTKGHLFTAQWMGGKKRAEREPIETKQVAECGHESKRKEDNSLLLQSQEYQPIMNELDLKLTHYKTSCVTVCVFSLLCVIKKVSTHHDIIRQLIWKSFEAVLQGFIIT